MPRRSNLKAKASRKPVRRSTTKKWKGKSSVPQKPHEKRSRPTLTVVEGGQGQPAFEMMAEDFESSRVNTDLSVLRQPQSELAQEIAALAEGETVVAEIKSGKKGVDHIYRVNPYDLHFEEGLNPRDFTTPAMRDRVWSMAHSIAARGVEVPLDVRVSNGKLIIEGGETRWRATMHAIEFLGAKVEKLPVILTRPGTNDVDRKINQWTKNEAHQFLPLEEGKLFMDAVRLGTDIVEIARRIGKPEAYVKYRITLQELPEQMKKLVNGGTISPGFAIKVWHESGENTVKAMAVLNEGLEKAAETGGTRVMPKHLKSGGAGQRHSGGGRKSRSAPDTSESETGIVGERTLAFVGELKTKLLDAGGAISVSWLRERLEHFGLATPDDWRAPMVGDQQ